MDEDRELSRTPNRAARTLGAGTAAGRPAGRRWAGWPALIAVPLLAAACGSSTSTVSVTPQAPSSTAPSTSTAPATNLKIMVNDGAGKVDNWTLTCDPAGGSRPDPAAACAALAAKGKTALPPVAKGIMCSQLFGGSQTATITGTWNGTVVNSSFTRRNGCEVSRWKQLQGLLPTEPASAGGVS